MSTRRATACPFCFLPGRAPVLLTDDGLTVRYRCPDCGRDFAVEGRELRFNLATDDDGFRLTGGEAA